MTREIPQTVGGWCKDYLAKKSRIRPAVSSVVSSNTSGRHRENARLGIEGSSCQLLREVPGVEGKQVHSHDAYAVSDVEWQEPDLVFSLKER